MSLWKYHKEEHADYGVSDCRYCQDREFDKNHPQTRVFTVEYSAQTPNRKALRADLERADKVEISKVRRSFYATIREGKKK